MRSTTKDKVLKTLKENCCNYISGQELADRLFVTRAAVWKAIKALKEEGYPIDGVNHKGYRLNMVYAPISKNSVLMELNPAIKDIEIEIYDEVTSTNDVAKAMAMNGKMKECIVIAEHQTKGRGRNSHDFFSPEGTGLYMSFLLFPKLEISKAAEITCMSAAAVCEALRHFTNEQIQIKWVNDIFLRKKKISGILTEAGLSLESQNFSYVVVGIGINLLPPDQGFPEELEAVAGVLFPDGNKEQNIRSKICARIIQNIMHYYHEPQDRSWFTAYQSLSMLTGHYIKIKNAPSKEKTYAYVKGIDQNCRLEIRYENGTEDILSAGEVSVLEY